MRGWLNRWLGDRGERAAVRFLKRLGYRIVVRNHRNRAGEIDIVALDGRTLVFVEVKTRQGDAAGLPVEAVDLRKQRQIVRTAQVFVATRRMTDCAVRFDVLALLWEPGQRQPDIRHYRHAFDAGDAGLFDA